MKKIVAIFLALALFTPLVSSGVKVKAETNTVLEKRTLKDLKEEIFDSPNTTKTFTFSFPKEAENIVKGSFQFSGKGEIVGEPKVDPKTREITVTLKGKEKLVSSKKVIGYATASKMEFPSNPGNAMCRYSDGIDWQIASVKTTDFTQTMFRFSNMKGMPSDVPYESLKKQKIATFVDIKLPTTGIYWFTVLLDENGKVMQDKNGKDIMVSVPTNQVETSTIELPTSAVSSTMGSPIFKNGYDAKNPTIGVQYNATEERPLKSLGVIKTNNPAFLTGHAACYMYASPMSYYVTATTLPSQSFDYSGTISFQYTKPTKAYIVGTLTANPTSTKFNDKDVKVKLTLDGEVKNLSDPGAIDYYMIYIRTEDSSINPPGIRIEGIGQLKVSGSIDFTIPKSKMTGKTEYTEIYVGQVRAYYKSSSYFVDPVNGKFMSSGQLRATSIVYKESTPPPPPPPQRHAPTAVIGSISEVLLGDDLFVHGYDSFDSDGTIETYRWTMNGAKNPITKNEIDGTIWYDTLGAKSIDLCVVDNDYLQDCTKHSLIVTEPIVKANITQTGTLKENRKVTLTANAKTSSRYPILDSKTSWKIESAYGDIPPSQIKTSSPLKGKSNIDVLFKKPGDYKVTLYMENTLGYNDEITRIYTILPDEVPYTNFTFQEKIYRDSVKGNIATFEFTDRSYSTDGDQIASRKWYVIFDANNDGIFNEPKVLFNSGNETNVIYESTHVGKYRFFLEVQEEFGQPTIDAFVTANDRRKSNTWE
ncbi:MAG: hypothetical protein NAG76_01160 [Candidatus Pristimantibacillus lignocellulolyticus]|uniref:PKD domain-containing protein n=1 Tax=Candidatus Pristimantibacillus lignocellulolyticus TaxID=2994561 RepID=A0A9J6ZFF5_9BACL|nr:MAG: hypothetical protein NAG76_01160 [Candidatus Pristimantibacillus lignocellulolyticus]